MRKTFKKENGITLVALIITIIILIILAAVAIGAAYESQLVEYATNGTQNYMEAAKTENEIFDNTISYVDSVLAGLGSGNAGGNGNTGGAGDADNSNNSSDEQSTSELESSDESSSEESSNEEENTGIDFAGMTEEQKNDMIGKYVGYEPISGTFDENTLDTYSGTTDNKAISTDESLMWRILAVDSSTLTLISDVPTESKLDLGGYNGYNNAVLLLNELCKTNYSNSDFVATARSLNRKDIEDISDFVPTTYKTTNTGYSNGTEYTVTGEDYVYYPTIFASEIGVNIDDGGYGTILQNEQTEYINQTETNQASSNLRFKFTDYICVLSEDYMTDIELDLIEYSPGTKSYQDDYWLASRCVGYSNKMANFCIANVYAGAVASYPLVDSWDIDRRDSVCSASSCYCPSKISHNW